LPRACLCRELNPRQSFPLPRAWICREFSRRQSLFAECPYWLSAKASFAEGLALGKSGLSAELPFPVVLIMKEGRDILSPGHSLSS
jgi:hypothetical protein